ncbi:MAG: hypothetical protein WB297_14460 [Actinomycetota bacterium]
MATPEAPAPVGPSAGGPDGSREDPVCPRALAAAAINKTAEATTVMTMRRGDFPDGLIGVSFREGDSVSLRRIADPRAFPSAPRSLTLIALGAVNRYHNVARWEERGSRPLLRTVGMEIALAAAVLGASVLDDLCDAVGSDLSRASRAYAFEHANMNRVALRALADDPRAVGAYRTVGFVEEGLSVSLRGFRAPTRTCS